MRTVGRDRAQFRRRIQGNKRAKEILHGITPHVFAEKLRIRLPVSPRAGLVKLTQPTT